MQSAMTPAGHTTATPGQANDWSLVTSGLSGSVNTPQGAFPYNPALSFLTVSSHTAHLENFWQEHSVFGKANVFFMILLLCFKVHSDNTESKFTGWAGSFSPADSRVRRWNRHRPKSRPRIQTAGNSTLTSRDTEGVEEKPHDGVVREGSQRSCLNQS